MSWFSGILDFWSWPGCWPFAKNWCCLGEKDMPQKTTNKQKKPKQTLQKNPKTTHNSLCFAHRFVLILEKICCCQTQGNEGLLRARFKVLLWISRVSLQHLSSEMPTKVLGPVCGCIWCVRSYSIAFTERNLLPGCFSCLLLKSRCNDNASVSAYW